MSSKQQLPFRFSIRTLLLLILVAAASITFGLWYIEWSNSRPIEIAVAEFNEKYLEEHPTLDEVMPFLTTPEVLGYLSSNEKEIAQAPSWVANTCRRIVKTERFPNTAQFNVHTWSSGGGESKEGGWRIGIEIIDQNRRHRVNLKVIRKDYSK